MGGTGIVWLRKNLRLHDNPSFKLACEKCDVVIPLCVLDDLLVHPSFSSPVKTAFYLESVVCLQEELRAIHSDLLLLRGSPVDLLASLSKQLQASVYTEFDAEPELRRWHKLLARAIQPSGEQLHLCIGNSMYDLERLLSRLPSGRAPARQSEFMKLVSTLGLPEKPVDTLTSKDLPSLDKDIAKDIMQMREFVPEACPAALDLPDEYTEAWEMPRRHWQGGEVVGLAKLASFVGDTDALARFNKAASSPATDDGRPSTSGLSPYLAIGCLSVRTIVAEVTGILSSLVGPHHGLHCGNSVLGQLFLREFFLCLGASERKLDTCVKGTNSLIELDVTWDGPADPKDLTYTWVSQRGCAYKCPEQSNVREEGDSLEASPASGTAIMDVEGGKQEQYDMSEDQLVMRWMEGKTGFPLIDAAMRQLNKEGWVHHSLRFLCAAFLNRGGLFKSWVIGARAFARMLTDCDWALNNSNWMCVSGTSSIVGAVPTRDPTEFARSGGYAAYIRKHVPELRNLDEAYIYSPWLAPDHVQEAAAVRIGEYGHDQTVYPTPMVDINERAANALKQFQNASRFGELHGRSKRKAESLVETEWQEWVSHAQRLCEKAQLLKKRKESTGRILGEACTCFERAWMTMGVSSPETVPSSLTGGAFDVLQGWACALRERGQSLLNESPPPQVSRRGLCQFGRLCLAKDYFKKARDKFDAVSCLPEVCAGGQCQLNRNRCLIDEAKVLRCMKRFSLFTERVSRSMCEEGATAATLLEHAVASLRDIMSRSGDKKGDAQFLLASALALLMRSDECREELTELVERHPHQRKVMLSLSYLIILGI
uniref:Photolyase/cryptochrome alpha/beta domain-containing protein n=1 Tax=Palpitomonas bilix TaxID=652834 RepID=A0A7S3DLB0_9EUKA|mmetsp:Transcript_43016/g.111191  ORF Transcript_43016/g.111191 Transcript_43016/m.111191 type:complete len:824 (+) Transcript_43016:148-2619(+)